MHQAHPNPHPNPNPSPDPSPNPEQVFLVPDVPSDRARWKRVKSAILVGMLRELEARGVALGRPWKRATMVVHEDP